MDPCRCRVPCEQALRQAQGERVVAVPGVLAESDDIHQFEPRKFLEGPGHVTVIGWERTCLRPGGVPFESDWVHVFNVEGDRITRFIGTLDTAARGAARR